MVKDSEGTPPLFLGDDKEVLPFWREAARFEGLCNPPSPLFILLLRSKQAIAPSRPTRTTPAAVAPKLTPPSKKVEEEEEEEEETELPPPFFTTAVGVNTEGVGKGERESVAL